MKGVIDHIDVRAVGKEEWLLLDNFEWFGIVVEKGFITDFGSIPRPVRFWINPVGELRPGYLVHDWLYNLRGKLKSPIIRKGTVKTVLTRKECDLELLNIAEMLNYNYAKRTAIYQAVRVGGWMHWNQK